LIDYLFTQTCYKTARIARQDKHNQVRL